MYNKILQHLNNIVYRKGRRGACLDIVPLKITEKIEKSNEV